MVPYFQTIPWDYVRPKVYQQERRFGDIPMFLENPTGIHSMSDIFTDPSWWRTRIYPSWIRRNSLPDHLNGEICGLTPSTGCIPSIKTTRSSTGSIHNWGQTMMDLKSGRWDDGLIEPGV